MPDSEPVPKPEPGPGDSQTRRRPAKAKKKPLLASEALKEDLAPKEPWAGGARIWTVLLGLALGATAAWPWLGRDAAPTSLLWALSLGIGVAAVAVGAAPFVPYRVRGGLFLVVGLACLILGVARLGPAAGFGHALGPWGALHMLAATTLPAALFFRARYRAYAGARRALAVALLLTLPFVGFCVARISQGPLPLQIVSGIAMAAVAVGLFGFMGHETTSAGSLLASAVIIAVGGTVGCEVILDGSLVVDLGLATRLSAAVAFAAAATIAALGGFQLLAAASYAEASKVDVHQTKKERPYLPSSFDPYSR